MEIYRLNYKVAKKATESGSEYKTIYVGNLDKAADLMKEILKNNKLYEYGVTITPTNVEE